MGRGECGWCGVIVVYGCNETGKSMHRVSVTTQLKQPWPNGISAYKTRPIDATHVIHDYLCGEHLQEKMATLSAASTASLRSTSGLQIWQAHLLLIPFSRLHLI